MMYPSSVRVVGCFASGVCMLISFISMTESQAADGRSRCTLSMGWMGLALGLLSDCCWEISLEGVWRSDGWIRTEHYGVTIMIG